MNYKVEAIVLKSRDIKEVDRIYTVFSREKGKLRIIGRGTRKPTAKLASGIEPITQSEIFLIQSRWLDKLTGVIIVNQFRTIKSREDRVWPVKALFDLVDQLSNEKEPNEQIFSGLVFLLEMMDQKEISPSTCQLVRLGLLWKVIQWSGFQPGMFACANCGTPIEEKENYWFDVSTGIECERCYSLSGGKKLRIDKNTVKIVRIFLTQPLPVIAKIVVQPRGLNQSAQLTKMMLEQILGKRVYL